MVYEFYANLYTSEPCESLDAILEAIPVKVNEEINEALCQDYTNDEIKAALFQRGPTKAPGPDGFPALFYQNHWELLEEDICAAVKGFLVGSEILDGFCDSVIVLIPKQKEASRDLKGPPISHLLSAATGDQRSVETLKSSLQTYCDGSGQKINLQKSSIFFGKNCSEQMKKVKHKLGVHDDTLQATYPGMPTWVGRSPMNCYIFLTSRLWKRLNGCRDRPLSRVGKEILVKSVAHAIPTYVMSCFQLPVGVCEKMRRPISNFWWGVEDGRRKIHWKSWNWLSPPKFLGGMGFRDMAIFNRLC